jgi:hypothetical protein
VDPVMGPLAIVRAKVETQIDMPEMPSMPKLIEIAHPEGVPGDYGIHPTFPHGGAYRLSMRIHPPAGDAFNVEFPLDIQDANSAQGRRAVKPRFWLELRCAPKTPKAGEPAALRLEIRERENPRAVYNNFERVHEKLMHLIIVSEDLAYFRHEHPEIGPDGAFSLRHVFPVPGDYHLFADVAPSGAGSQVMFAKVKAGGKATLAAGLDNGKLSLRAEAGKTLVEIAPAESPVQTGRTKTIPALFRNAGDGTPVTDLESYLGAKAHLILIHEDAVTSCTRILTSANSTRRRVQCRSWCGCPSRAHIEDGFSSSEPARSTRRTSRSMQAASEGTRLFCDSVRLFCRCS